MKIKKSQIEQINDIAKRWNAYQAKLHHKREIEENEMEEILRDLSSILGEVEID